MKLFEYISKLLFNTKKADVSEDLRITAVELDNIAMPSYRAANEHFKVNKLSSKEAKKIADQFYDSLRNLKGPKQASLAGDIERRLAFVKDVAEYLGTQVDKLMESNSVREGLTAKKAILIRAAESVSFISRYSIDLLNYLYSVEAIDNDRQADDTLRLAPDTIAFVQRNISRFAALLSDYGIPLDDFKKIIGEVPDVFVNKDTVGAIVSGLDEKSVDPFNGSLMSGFVGNPIYHFRLVIAVWQDKRYKANKEKKAMLELRLLHLQMQQEKKNSPELEDQIAYNRARVDKIEREMRYVEETLEDGNE